ncbi:M10 family metallopeptidase C-terminal domain-containing protein [Hyphomicrobium sp. LHD-15]|uniref:M10 family metallopeptidase C-terminal domain-containing protein n=1 Tax=Hyphomicrobium sp. LHD-15 TaxID=3072142 RepID=UPI00280E14C2|nr:M10 family metallopeptidase C-terminal domain-containing protein [Hyphomicrobium sp. LHD-15]MDQ8699025.1 M10 family metallopeptidase C-terminal domain-containing protein [Hyphomicrobium sp. LHD-15]
MAKPVWTSDKIVAQLDSGAHWSGGNLTYSFPTNASWAAYGEKAGFSALNSAQQTAATSAIGMWDSLIAPKFTLTASDTADIKFANTTTSIGYAHAYFPGQSLTSGSVWLNPNYGANSGTNNLVDPQVGQWGYQAYVHEIGHALGLEHPGNYNGGSPTYQKHALFQQDSQQYTVMSYFTADKTGADWIASDGKRYYAQTPMLYDILTIQNIYGEDTETRDGNTTYGYNSTASDAVFDFTQNLHPVLCIYDSYGIDTLDLSGSSYACVINLDPGSFSNSDMMTSNISIAFGTWIEDAIGTAQNDILRGNAIDNVLSGLDGNDTLIGGDGSDTLYGGEGNDTLDGGTGADTLLGGAGNDLYTVDNAGDAIIEGANGGSDTVQTALATFTLANNVENLTYIGNGSFVGFGSAQDNVLKGGASHDQLFGGNGNDTLIGGAGNDLLDGGSGTDLLQGGLGNDTYVVDNASDTIVESAKAGTDTVHANVSTFTLANNLENLVYIGTGSFDGIGNALVNTLTGGDQNDTLKGLAGNDILYGAGGNDVLDGGAGTDKMFGGAGDDTYVVDNARDLVTEGANAGTDTILTTLRSYTLGADVENLTFIGSGAFKASGNALDNVITGGAGKDVLSGNGGNDHLIGGDGADILIGGAGADTLTGGAGADVFRFSALSDSNTLSYDTITDFNAAESDKIDLSQLDANAGSRGNQAFAFIGASSFSGVAGQLSFSNGFLSADVNGDGASDFGVWILNVTSLTAAQFWL